MPSMIRTVLSKLFGSKYCLCVFIVSPALLGCANPTCLEHEHHAVESFVMRKGVFSCCASTAVPCATLAGGKRWSRGVCCFSHGSRSTQIHMSAGGCPGDLQAQFRFFCEGCRGIDSLWHSRKLRLLSYFPRNASRRTIIPATQARLDRHADRAISMTPTSVPDEFLRSHVARRTRRRLESPCGQVLPRRIRF